MRLATFALTACLSILAIPAMALNTGDRVDNFRLIDQRGASHELYYLSDMNAVVLLVQKNGCDASQQAIRQLTPTLDQYRARGIAVLMLNSNPKEGRADVLGEVEELGSPTPVLLDPLQLVGEALDTRTAGEVLVVDPKRWVLTYRGAVRGVSDALDATLAGTPVRASRLGMQTRNKDCRVALPERKRVTISYEKTIAPMLIDKCMTCHREGGIGPWQMSSYEVVRGFGPMIREVIRTQRMPPWHADPNHGTFGNIRALSDADAKTLVHWIEAGAPRGKGADPLAQYQKAWPTWALGEPDLVVEIPAFDVPATGAIPYQRPVVKNPLGRDVWLRAIDMAPTNRPVVHHILAGLTTASADGSSPTARAGLESITAMGVYVPGDVPHALPAETGVRIPKDSDFIFQVHYTANGKAVQEKTRVGLYFAKEPPKYPLRNTVLLDPRLKIPPNTKEHSASVTRLLNRDILVYTLMAHAHVRGSGAQFAAAYPDGREEILLSVPHYDFNWQTSYELAEPKLLPKGTRLIYRATYDNSAQNKANPDPNVEVRWGEQTWEEMIYGDVRFRFVDEINVPKASTAGN